jgi:hypothetical protein
MSVTRTAPKTVRAAAFVAWTVLALVVLRTVLAFVRADELLDARSEEWPSREFVEQRMPLLTAVALGVLAAAVALALAAVFLPRGARWARIVAMLFALLVVAGSEVLVWTPTIGPLLIIDVVVTLLCIAVVMLLNPRQVRRRFGR